MKNKTYEDIERFRNKLVTSLLGWGHSSDGLYATGSIRLSGHPPSISNSGIVLQAFNEAGRVSDAHKLADNLLQYYKKGGCEPFTYEKDVNGKIKHVMCNSWAVFSILDCYPRRVEELKPICDWFLETQNEDHSWDLIPGTKTKYPVFTAYSISALLQFYDRFDEIKYSDSEYLTKIKKAIRDGIEFLLNNRYNFPKGVRDDLLLWPANYNNEGAAISFSNSAMCMHILMKGSKILQEDSWREKVAETFLLIIKSFNLNNPSSFKIEDQEIRIWDFIQVMGEFQYLWDFFAPINVVTFLRFIDDDRFNQESKYFQFIDYFLTWIFVNEARTPSGPGIKASENNQDVKTWPTALSVIVLSRILHNFRKIRKYYGEFPSLPMVANRLQEIVKKDVDISNLPKSLRLRVNLLGVLVATTIILPSGYFLGEVLNLIWAENEGRLTVWNAIGVVVLSAIGFSFSKLWNGIRKLLFRYFFRNRYLIEEIQSKFLGKEGE